MRVTLGDIPTGTYYLACAYGSHWDPKKSRFRCNKSFSVFNKYSDLMAFSSNEVGAWEMTLYQQRTSRSNSGPQSISESQFDNY